MIQRRYYKTIRVIVDSDGGGTPFYIENVDTVPGYFMLYKFGNTTYTPNLNYRIDNGEWFEYDVVNLPRIEVPVGSKIYLKGNNTNGFNREETNYYHLYLYKAAGGTQFCNHNIGGYITSLLALENFHLIDNIPNYAFRHLFNNNKGLKSAEDLITDNIINLGSYSFYSCFRYCEALVTAPKFDNITSISKNVFMDCFNSCTSLVTAPTFENVTEFGGGSLSRCFEGCTSLVIPPLFEKLTSVSESGFGDCFKGCTSLVTTPNFRNVTTLSSGAFSNCFNNCTALETIIAPRPSTWSSAYFYNWVSGVPSTGTFYKKKGLEIPTGTYGIPDGWTVVEED